MEVKMFFFLCWSLSEVGKNLIIFSLHYATNSGMYLSSCRESQGPLGGIGWAYTT